MTIKNAGYGDDILATIGNAASLLIMERKPLGINDISSLLKQHADEACGSGKESFVKALELIAAKKR